MKSICRFYFTLCVIVIVTSNFIFGLYNEKYCRDSIFYKPYARFYTEKNGKLLFEVNSGFQTFQTEGSLYMCLNGPAIFYENTMKTLSVERLFAEARLGIYVHQCTYVNTDLEFIPPTTGASLGTIISSTQIEGMDCKGHTADPRTTNLPPSPNFRHKIWGIFMLGDSNDYRLPRVNLFYDKSYETRTDLVFYLDLSKPPLRTIKEAHGLSIISCGNMNHCLSVPGKDFAMTQAVPGLTPLICFRPQQNNDIYFQNLTISTSVKLSPEGGMDSLCTPTTEKLPLDDCFPLPVREDECKKYKPNINFTCQVGRIITAIESPIIVNNKLRWHIKTLDLMADIFEKVCVSVPRNFLDIMQTMIYYYINKAETLPANPNVPKPVEYKRPFWDFLHDSMDECKDKVKPLKFGNLSFESIYEYKRNLIFINETTDGDKPLRLFYFKERADREEIFNHIIEMQWIVFATVLGICPMHYSIKTGSISSQLYTYFTEDFLIPLTTLWVDSIDNQIYEFLLEEFINDEMHTKALSCLEASYIQSNTIPYRHLRPLHHDCYKTDNTFTQIPTQDYFTSKPTDRPKRYQYYVPPFK